MNAPLGQMGGTDAGLERAAGPECGSCATCLLYMSLIHTCELNDANPFHYLTELQKHATELAWNPAAWMPWNYRETLQPAGTTQPST